MELILSVNAAVTLTLLVVQVLEYIVEWTRPALSERHLAASVEELPRIAAIAVTEPTAHYDRAA